MDTTNRVELIGYVGRDPEIVNLENGKKLAKFALATNEFYQNSGGEWITNTTWHRIVAWGHLADLIENLISKGQKMQIIGKIKTNVFEATDGTKKYYTDIRCDEFRLMGAAEGQENPAPTETAEHSGRV